ncbi:ABC-type hemin transport system, ATPase component [Sinomicrobium oceani]|uniref:ABC-type hemin transport system, ATPase component n=1 Tax=Sinomicrobium oceani TaxID=1150368 RepID=A0A1K1M7P7_9FLAO|nr:heme ABC transporter ATP-binding protein [Sinomicrobium oceani]SFW19160.1 ABC-type hemin transport system, ATPase component [Sinomicrobium oceani]
MLRVESVSYQINGRYLLKDISFSIRKGEIAAILGANGAGKSTLMKILCREKKPTEGRVVYDGKDLNTYTARELSAKRATLYQQNTVSMAFTVAEIVMMGRYNSKHGDHRSDSTALSETMEICGVSHLAERSMLTLSGGEQQRVHLARVLAQVWDNKNALLLLDEPVSNMDMRYQHQTLAIANALAKRGYMIVCVLHEINLAAQYADRIIMLKGGRKWWDGAPEEVLTTRNIYTAFGLHTSVQTDPATLITRVTPSSIKYDAAAFNSNLSEIFNRQSLKERFIAYRDQYPARPLWHIADTLGVSEADLVLLGLEENVTILSARPDAILKAIGEMGLVQGMTRNVHCHICCTGVYRDFFKEENTSCFQGEDTRLKISTEQCKIILAVEAQGKESLQFFTASGQAIHKIFLTDAGNRNAFLELLDTYKQHLPHRPEIEKKKHPPVKERRDAEINIMAFHEAWNTLTRAEEFSQLVTRFRLTPMQALRLAPPRRAMQVSLEVFRRTITQCLSDRIPVAITTGNENCQQESTGQLHDIYQKDQWLEITQSNGSNTVLNQDAVHSVWHVIRPVHNTCTDTLELYDTTGQMIVQFSGVHHSENPETWKKILGNTTI